MLYCKRPQSKEQVDKKYMYSIQGKFNAPKMINNGKITTPSTNMFILMKSSKNVKKTKQNSVIPLFIKLE